MRPYLEEGAKQLFLTGPDPVLDHPWFAELDPFVFARFKTFHAQHPELLDLYARFAREAGWSGRRIRHCSDHRAHPVVSVRGNGRDGQERTSNSTTIFGAATQGSSCSNTPSWMECSSCARSTKHPKTKSKTGGDNGKEKEKPRPAG